MVIPAPHQRTDGSEFAGDAEARQGSRAVRAPHQRNRAVTGTGDGPLEAWAEREQPIEDRQRRRCNLRRVLDV